MLTDAQGRLLAAVNDAAILASVGLTSDPKVTNPDDNTSGATMIAELKGILNALSSTLPVQTYVSNSYNNITTKTTTVVKAVPGTLCKVIINKTGATDVLTIYDNVVGSGTVIATITAPTVGMSFVYDATCALGITIVTSGGTAGDYTAIFR